MPELLLRRLMEIANTRIGQMGYVGLDLNMAVKCIVQRRLGIEWSHNDYWADRRSFCHYHPSSEDEILRDFAKNHQSELAPDESRMFKELTH